MGAPFERAPLSLSSFSLTIHSATARPSLSDSIYMLLVLFNELMKVWESKKKKISLTATDQGEPNQAVGFRAEEQKLIQLFGSSSTKLCIRLRSCDNVLP
ncbi:hypothetical protein MRX96_053019 [Rhipicephalus microplus]